MTKVRTIQVVVLLFIFTFFLQGCFYDEWFDEYPIAYGEGIVWMCEDENVSFQASFETVMLNYGHYGQGEFTYNDSSEQFELLFHQDSVTFVYFDGFEYQTYFGGVAEFGETCMQITIDQVDDRFVALLGSELSFYRMK